jgi:hypothetical protein
MTTPVTFELTTADGETFEVDLDEVLASEDLDGDAIRSIWSLTVGQTYKLWAPVGLPSWSLRRVS